jgi:hypothetical protein
MLLIQFLRGFREKMRLWKHVIVPLALYAIIYSVYFFFWMPEILEFWLGQCIVCWLLLLGTYRGPVKRLNIIAGTLAVLLFVINYTTSILPMQDIKNDIGYARIDKIRQTVTPGDLVVVQDPWLLKEFLEYYTKARVRVVPQQGLQQIALHQDIDSTLKDGHRVFIFPAKSSANAAENKDFIPAVQKEYTDRMKLFQEEISTVWVIE